MHYLTSLFQQRSTLLPAGIVTVLLSAGIVLLCQRTKLYKQVELALVDARFFTKSEPEQDTDIVHVDIDDQSINKIGRWPWNREIHADVIRVLNKLGAETIAFDVLFPDPQKPVLKKEFLPRYDQGVTRLFNTFQERVRNLRELHEFLVETDAISETHLNSLQENIHRLEREIDKGKNELTTLPEMFKTDPDRVLAQQIQKAGNVILITGINETDPFRSLETYLQVEQVESISPDGARKIVRHLTNRLDLSAEDLTEKTGMEQAKIALVLPDLKTFAANKLTRRFLVEQPGGTLEELYEEVKMPRDLQIEKKEQEDLRHAFHQIKTAKFVEDRFGTSLLSDQFPVAGHLNPPMGSFARSAGGIGHVNVKGSPIDGKLRTVPPVYTYNGSSFYLLGLRTALASLDVSPKDVRYQNGQLIIPSDPKRRIPLNQNNHLLLNWNNRTWNRYGGPHLSYAKIYGYVRARQNIRNLLQYFLNKSFFSGEEILGNALNNGEIDADKLDQRKTEILTNIQKQISKLDNAINQSKEKDNPKRAKRLTKRRNKLRDNMKLLKKKIKEKERLRNRIQELVEGNVCLIGSSHTGSTDRAPTPYHPDFPKAAIHSTVHNMVTGGNFLQSSSTVTDVLLVFLGSFLGVVFVFPDSVNISALLSLITLIAYGVIQVVLFRSGYLVEFAGFPAGLILSFSSMTLYNLFAVKAEREKTRNLFKRYVDRTVVDEIMKNPEAVEMGGTRKHVTVFFLDIANFTTISEKNSPVSVVSLLSEILNELTNVIFEHRGTLDKYEGDAIMAYWGAPVEVADQEKRACRAALDCQNAMDQLDLAERDSPVSEIQIRIGINTGNAVVGNIGSKQRADYTVLGDQVNLAARLEAGNKFFGTRILITESTHREVRDEMTVRELCTARVKGRDEPVKLYELIGRTDTLDPADRSFLQKYRNARNLFLDRNWSAAEEAFQECLEERDDRHCRIMLARIREFQENPPPEGTEDIIDISGEPPIEE